MTGTQVGFMNPTNLTEAMECAQQIAHSNFIPKAFKGNPGDILVAGQMAAELGIPWLQGLQGICVINGNPSVWGDLALALVRRHPRFEDMKESYDEETRTATCTIKIKDQATPVTQTFSWADACQAGLNGKETYKKYRRRMLQMRARSWCMRDALPDALKGMAMAEEQMAVQEAYAEPIETDVNGEKRSGMDALNHAVNKIEGPKQESKHPEGSPEWWGDMLRQTTSLAQLEKVGFELRAADPQVSSDLRGAYEAHWNDLKNEPFIEGESEAIEQELAEADGEPA